MLEQDLCPSLQQCQKRHARWPGTWQVAPQRAISLMPGQASELLIVQGNAWITWEAGKGAGPHGGQDLFLSAGQSLRVPAGVRVVMESVHWGRAVDFDWRIAPQGCPVRAQTHKASVAGLWRDWVQAWVQLAQASVRLAAAAGRKPWPQAWGPRAPVAVPGPGI
jgi:hypothetical protein